MSSTNSNPWDIPSYELTTTEQAIVFLDHLVERASQARSKSLLAGTRASEIEWTKVFYMRQGAGLGAARALHRVKLVPDETYERFQKILTDLGSPQIVNGRAIVIGGRW